MGALGALRAFKLYRLDETVFTHRTATVDLYVIVVLTILLLCSSGRTSLRDKSDHSYSVVSTHDTWRSLTKSSGVEPSSDTGDVYENSGQRDTLNSVAATRTQGDQDHDPVVEYDMLFATEDGSRVVLDAVSNLYFRIEDVYGKSVELIECTAEDGNLYTCVVVRKSQLESRARWQQQWLDAQELSQQPHQSLVVPTPRTNSNEPDGAPGTMTVVSADVAVDQLPCQEDTDVASLMQLLCV